MPICSENQLSSSGVNNGTKHTGVLTKSFDSSKHYTYNKKTKDIIRRVSQQINQQDRFLYVTHSLQY